MRLRIVEVGPRDGLQNEKTHVSTPAKVRFIERLAAAGLSEVEATSFVSPRWVPQLADADLLWPVLPHGPAYSALVPNMKGLDRALAVGVARIAVFTSASESFARHNINMSISDSLIAFREVIGRVREVGKENSWVRGYVSTAFECPYDGRISSSQVIRIARQLLALGVDEISLGDTIGAASPTEIRRLALDVGSEIPNECIAFHFHDTHGTALANVMAAVDLGFSSFDSSAGGLGGCPYAPGAAGNLATEDLVYLAEREGLETQVDLRALAEASLEILSLLGRPPAAKAQVAVLSHSSESPSAT
jgi:isopropylmalate/homocitrate/citramalate synthase